jgi:hypothetical protein
MMSWFRRLIEGTAAAPEAAHAPQPPPQPQVDFDDPRLPERARQQSRGIDETISDLLARNGNAAFDQILIAELRQMRDEHLPKLLRSYIDVPQQHRKEIFKNTGRSASYLLEEALDKMRGRVNAISRDLAQSELDAFSNNTEFVNRRYGRIDDPFA